MLSLVLHFLKFSSKCCGNSNVFLTMLLSVALFSKKRAKENNEIFSLKFSREIASYLAFRRFFDLFVRYFSHFLSIFLLIFPRRFFLVGQG